MVAFGLLHASFALLAFLAPATLAAPTGNTTVVTPFGEFPSSQVVHVPERNVLPSMENDQVSNAWPPL